MNCACYVKRIETHRVQETIYFVVSIHRKFNVYLPYIWNSHFKSIIVEAFGSKCVFDIHFTIFFTHIIRAFDSHSTSSSSSPNVCRPNCLFCLFVMSHGCSDTEWKNMHIWSVRPLFVLFFYAFLIESMLHRLVSISMRALCRVVQLKIQKYCSDDAKKNKNWTRCGISNKF